MSNTTNITVRLRDQNHPSGRRTRAWITVLVEPTTVQVTNEQLLAIKNDPFIQILKNKETPVKVPEKKDEESVVLSKANKVTLVKILIDELWQIAEKDFDPNASNKVLENLIITLRDQKLQDEKDAGSGDAEDDEDEGDDDGSEDDDDTDE